MLGNPPGSNSAQCETLRLPQTASGPRCTGDRQEPFGEPYGRTGCTARGEEPSVCTRAERSRTRCGGLDGSSAQCSGAGKSDAARCPAPTDPRRNAFPVMGSHRVTN